MWRHCKFRFKRVLRCDLTPPLLPFGGGRAPFTSSMKFITQSINKISINRAESWSVSQNNVIRFVHKYLLYLESIAHGNMSHVCMNCIISVIVIDYTLSRFNIIDDF